MKHILTVLLLTYSLLCVSQVEQRVLLGIIKTNTISPIDAFPFSLVNSSLLSDSKRYRDYGLIAGFELNKKLSLSIALTFMNLADGSSYGETKNQNMKTIKSGLNLSYRFLKNSMLSPKIGLQGGFIPYSDIVGEVVNPTTLVSNDETYDGWFQYQFSAWDLYGSLEAMLSVRLNNFDLDFGAEINYLSYSLRYKDPMLAAEPKIIIRDFGMGLKVAILYMIPIKIKKKSKRFNEIKTE